LALYVDSALIEEVREACDSGLVSGVTTNPLLIAQAGRPAYELIQEICEISPGSVFYQLTTTTPEEMEEEGQRFADISPSQVVLKIPCTLPALRVVASLSEDVDCAVTAIYSPAQAYLAIEAGARYVIPYVNRATRLMGDGLELVRSMAGVVAAAGREAEVLAASLKTPDEVVATLLAGAKHVTVPYAVIKAMASHPLTEAAIQEFARAAQR